MQQTISCIFLFLVINLCYISGGLLSKFSNIFNRNKEKKIKLLLPKLLPHPDTCYLIEFVADGSDHCEQMEPVVKRLEEDLDTKVLRININRRSEFVGLFELCGGNECGNVPFFYNRRTAQAICGATPYVNLRKLGTGDTSHLFNDAPQNIYEKADYDPRKQRDIGVKDYLMEKFIKMDRSRKNNNKNKKTDNKNSNKKA